MVNKTSKNVEFHSKNKFEKLMCIFGCIIRIYHDACSPERQKNIQCAQILKLLLLMKQKLQPTYI